MFDKSRLQDALVYYKRDFVSKQWENEKFKWEAVQWFQDHWDVNASDFAGMLEQSLAKTEHLLRNRNNFPASMITGFAASAPEEVRSMFIALFDESNEVYERISAFREKSADLLEKYGNGAKQHYQYENPISVYLWLRYPDQYYIYKYGDIKIVSDVLKSDLKFKKGAYADNVRNFYRFYDELCAEIRQDDELVNLFRGQLTDDCYPDPELHTLTIDIGFYISRIYSQRDALPVSADEYIGSDFDPGLTEEDWLSLLHDNEVFNQQGLEIVKRMKDCGGEATCKQLSLKYGETVNFYNRGSSSLAQRVARKTGCPTMKRENGEKCWWPILYTGRNAGDDEEGGYVWKLRSELASALDKMDFSGAALQVQTDIEDETNEMQTKSKEESQGYWWLNANPKIWSYSGVAVGEILSYTMYNEDGHKRRIFRNFLEAKAGDMVIGYETNPIKQIVALCRISSEHDEEQIYFEKVEGLTSPIDYQTLKNSPELAGMEFFTNPNGSLFKLTKDEYNFIMDMIREENPIQKEESTELYGKEDFLKEVYMSRQRYDRLVSLLKNKKNIILQGAPGVGKTFTARRLAYSMMGKRDDSHIEVIQFHQNYAYEDFMMGYKPVEDGFELKYGVFYRFCQKAANHPDQDFFFIIDEINRGNMSKIFGELLMLIESGYRDTRITLPYNGMTFSVPSNLYIIGMMNTADRSLAMIDYALRRRFSFFEIEPGFDSEGFLRYQNSLDSPTFNDLMAKIKELNAEISKDKSLGKGFCIGHSYFCEKNPGVDTDDWLREKVEFDILPMLSEYWFDDADKVSRWENILLGVFQ